MGKSVKCSIISLLLVLVLTPLSFVYCQNYKDALSKSILYFENQRSGFLPPNQRVQWRGNSGLHDGKPEGVDLVGGYYDAGDNVKFGFPMAFTITMLSWGIIEYGKQLSASGEMNNALDAVKWGTDYFIKAHPHPNVLYGQVGDGDSDHTCWMRPEDMKTPRTVFKIDTAHPGSELAAETAGAMAAASIAFSGSNSGYAKILIGHATQLFDFAVKFQGVYSETIPGNFYKSFSGYHDELLWAAVWLYKATKNETYLSYLADNGDALGGTGTSWNLFGWDNKYAGVQTLVSEILYLGEAGQHASTFQNFQARAEEFMCNMIGKGNNNVKKTPNGLIYVQEWNNLQYSTTASFLSIVYSDYLNTAKKQLSCASGVASSNDLFQFGKFQVDYILGKNPMGMSYMVGFSNKFPQHVHHRGASIVSIKKNPTFVSCKDGFNTYYSSPSSNPNVLTGAVVGGPNGGDKYNDDRSTYSESEACTYNTAPLVGILARLNIG